MKHLSIVVPVYNVEHYLRKCLDSLVNQTLENIEIVVVNDGSKDDSQKIIEEFQQKYPDKIVSFQKENGGCVSSGYGNKNQKTSSCGHRVSPDGTSDHDSLRRRSSEDETGLYTGRHHQWNHLPHG